jgi:ATP-dependent helicase/DNAse subunit B
MSEVTCFYAPVYQPQLIQRLRESVQSGNKVDFLLPSVRHIQHLKKSLLRGLKGTMPGQIYMGTYIGWANRILDWRRRSYQIMSAGEEWFLLFNYFLKNPGGISDFKTGSVGLFQQIIVDLRESGFSVTDLEKDLGNISDPKFKLLISLLKYLDHFEREHQFASSSTILQLANYVLEEKGRLPIGDLLVVDGFYEYNPVQKSFLKNLISLYKRVFIYIPDRTTSHPVLNYLQPINEEIECNSEIVIPPDLKSMTFFNHLADSAFRHQFKKTKSLSDRIPTLHDNNRESFDVKIVRCPTRRREVETAARSIKHWLNNEVAIDRVAVLFRGGFNYSKLIRLIFPQYGLPVPDKDRKLSDTIPVRLIQKVLEINEKRFSYESIVDLARFSDIRRYYGAETIQKFEYKSASWGLSFGNDTWIKQLERRKEYLKTLINSGMEDDRDKEYFAKEIDDIDKIYPVLSQFLKDISLPEKAGWIQYGNIILKLLEKYFDKKDSRGYDIEAVDNIRSVCRKMVVLSDRNNTVCLRHFTMAFNVMTDSVVLEQSVRQPNSKILFSDIMNARGEQFDNVVILGMIDGEFPMKRRENPILNKRQRDKFNERFGAKVFSSTGANIAEEKYLFYQVLNQVNKALLITYPQSDSSGHSYVESPFLNEIMGFADGNDSGDRISYETVPASAVIPEIGKAVSTTEIEWNLFQRHWRSADLHFLKEFISKEKFDGLSLKISIENLRRENRPTEWSGVLNLSRSFEECFEKLLSVTQVQQYAWCPFLYLCRYVWKVDTVEEPTAELPPLSEGLLIHALFEYFLKKAHHGTLEQWREYLNGDLNSAIEEAVEHIDTRFRTKFGFTEDIVWHKKLNDLRKGLKLFIKRERESLQSRFYPQYLEQDIRYLLNVPAADPGRPGLKIPFRAKIDRIDRNPDGDIMVIEYKRSRTSVQDPLRGVEEGIHFQIPFYLLIAREKYPDNKLGGAYSYIFYEGKLAKGVMTGPHYRYVKVVSPEEMENLLDQTRSKIINILQQIRTGNFVLNPYDPKRRCEHGKCEYYDVCRIDTRHLEISDEDA